MSIASEIKKNLKIEDAEFDHGMLSTGLAGVDWALGGGFARGKISEGFGPESSCKTTLMLLTAAGVQRNGGEVIYVDTEHALDKRWCEKHGLDFSKLDPIQPSNAEQALSCVEQAVEACADLVILDSVAAMSTRREIEGDLGDANVGDKARLMSQAMRRLAARANMTGTTVLFVNQIREKVGVMFGSPETTPGGRALKFASAQRIDTRKGLSLKKGDAVYGSKFKVKVVKNKVAPAFRQAEFVVDFERGVDVEASLVEFALSRGVLTKSGGWVRFEDTNLGNGLQNAADALRGDAKLAQTIHSLAVGEAE